MYLRVQLKRVEPKMLSLLARTFVCKAIVIGNVTVCSTCLIRMGVCKSSISQYSKCKQLYALIFLYHSFVVVVVVHCS